MRILFLCTAHNSLSQRLQTVLAPKHYVTVEYALSEQLMIEAADMVKPDLIICPFLTTRVPAKVHNNFMTLIIHPGPPGDIGPSSLDWLLMGDDGSEPDTDRLLRNQSFSEVGRSHWGVTIIQATAELDEGPVWAFDQFPVDINDCRMTKSALYRGHVTRSAVVATLTAIERIQSAAVAACQDSVTTSAPSPTEMRNGAENEVLKRLRPCLSAKDAFRRHDVAKGHRFMGGKTQHRSLLRAAQRDFDPEKHTAAEISRRIRSADSQPGCLSTVFGPKLYLYGGVIETCTAAASATAGSILMSRDNAVCISTCDNKGVWITHIRRVKEKDHSSLWPKVPALQALHELQEAGVTIHGLTSILPLQYGADLTNGWHRSPGTFQEIWIEFEVVGSDRVAYLHFDFYNGAMSTAQCKRLLRSLKHLVQSSTEMPLAAIVLMGGSYFSNGIHLNVIETAADPAQESWLNINAINDLVQYVLQEFPAGGIATIAAARGNCAAGGVALAASCDRVLAGEAVVINPAYGAMGLSGSEFHTMTYHKRCKSDAALQATVSTLPLSAWAAKEIGLVDEVIPGWGHSLDASIRANIAHLLQFSKEAQSSPILPWKRSLDLGTISVVRTAELAEMAKDFWSPRSERYHTRRRAFVTKQKPTATPIQFALHRKHDGVTEEIDGTCGSTEPSIPRESMETGYPSIKRPIATNISPCNSQSATTVRIATTTQHGETLLESNSGILFGCYYIADS